MNYGERFDDALVFASRLHRSQKRKGTGIPYVTHLLSVAALVGEDGGTEDEVIAALLHDAVEDQGGESVLQQITERFGQAVANVVKSCSDTDQTPKPPWRRRKERYLAHLETASPSAMRVSAADKLHNARCLVADLRQQGENVWSKFNGGKDGTLWYYRSIREVLLRRLPESRSVVELNRVVSEVQELTD